MGKISKEIGHKSVTMVTLKGENLPGKPYSGGVFSPPMNRAQRRSRPKKLQRYMKG